MTKVKIDPGVCGFITLVTADMTEEDDDVPYAVKVHVASGCPSVKKMMQELGEDFDGMEMCLCKPGKGRIYEYAQQNFPVHAACPILNGIIKCVEAECGMALKKNAAITFEE